MTYPRELRAAMAAKYAEGEACAPIAAEFGCSMATVMKAVRDHGGTPRAFRRRRCDLTWTRRQASNGYIVWTRWDSDRDTTEMLSEHRLFMGWKLGRPLLPHESVHHKNGVRSDNRPGNLELWVSTQPAGQRVVDLLDWARDLVAEYGHLSESQLA